MGGVKNIQTKYTEMKIMTLGLKNMLDVLTKDDLQE